SKGVNLMSSSLQENGFIFLKSVFTDEQIANLTLEFETLKNEKLKNKEISLDSYDADQKRFEIMNPPLLKELYKSSALQKTIKSLIKEPVKINNRFGYFCYHEGSYIKPHFDHILTDCMLIICLKRIYGKNDGKGLGGVLKIYVPQEIKFDRKGNKETGYNNCRIEDISLNMGDSIFLAGGHVMHECTPVEEGGLRLICGMGYVFTKTKK
ncbi:hypothetical protein, partial [Candidatus Protochlamydia sp. W-9]|uniref:hypothetical protein n=1 Tax=Candidatus Protochlamydia sp. W-9 TaxID=1785087 RepID=UPI001D057E20